MTIINDFLRSKLKHRLSGIKLSLVPLQICMLREHEVCGKIPENFLESANNPAAYENLKEGINLIQAGMDKVYLAMRKISK